MDWITQAALGAATGEWIMGKRLGNRALAWGALIAVIPDLSGLFAPFVDSARKLSWQNAGSHSLVVMGLACWGISYGVGKLWRREKISGVETVRFVAGVWGIHLLADCLGTSGAALLWPLSSKPMAFNVLSSTDLLFALPLMVTAVWLACLREQKVKKTRGKKAAPPSARRKLCMRGLGLAAGYAAFALGMKLVASFGFDADLARRGTRYERRTEAPTSSNVLLWRAVVDRGDELWIGYRSVFELHDTPVRWTVYPKGREAFATVSTMRQARSLAELSNGWWLARPHAKGAWLCDVRFPEKRVWGNKKSMVDSRFERSWIIDAKTEGDHLRRVYAGESPDSDYPMRLASRIVGKRERWEANPRLAGIAGSLPEFLPVEE